MTGITKITSVKSLTNSVSLRTTIPKKIRKKLEVKEGDHLSWEIDEEDKIVISKIK